jgi:DNA polymerase-3 subunit epsilon
VKIIFFDTETTGIEPGSICQLSYILVDTSTKPHKTVGKNIFFSVDYVEPEAERVHGFSVEMLYELSEGKYFEDCFEDFIEDFQTADVIIGHNVNFDLKFLKYELEGCGEYFNPKHTFCTMNYYKNICKILNQNGNYKQPRLEEVVKFLGLKEDDIDALSRKLFNGTGKFHDARFDTTATYLIVTEGIKRGYIPKQYFSRMVSNSQRAMLQNIVDIR